MKKVLLLLLFFPLMFISCKREARKVQFAGEAQGTYYAVTYYDTLARNFQPEIDSLLKDFDRSASIWVKSSVISRINRNESRQTDSVFRTVFRMAKMVSEETNGAFDISVGPLAAAWGWGFEDRMKLDSAKVDSLKDFVGYRKMRLENNKLLKENPNSRIDFNAIAQGYSVDLVGRLLESKGIESYLVDIGGEVLAKGKKPQNEAWKVGIEKPQEHADSLGRSIEAIIRLSDMALATSGNYRKFYVENGQKFSHTINPLTGYPVRHSLLSASVMYPSCALADAYATSFMVMGLKESKAFLKYHPEIQAFLIFSDEQGNLKTWFTKGFEDIQEEM